MPTQKEHCSFNHRELPNCDVCEKLKCKHPKKQEDWEMKSDEIIVDFFEKLHPCKKGEAHTWLIPLMIVLKFNLEEACQAERSKTLAELEEFVKSESGKSGKKEIIAYIKKLKGLK